MDLQKTSYTKFRMYLAKHLNDILSSNGALKILWRGHEPCVLITEKQYQEFMKLRDIQIHTSCTDKSDKTVLAENNLKIKPSIQKNSLKTPASLIYKSQPDLFQ